MDICPENRNMLWEPVIDQFIWHRLELRFIRRGQQGLHCTVSECRERRESGMIIYIISLISPRLRPALSLQCCEQCNNKK